MQLKLDLFMNIRKILPKKIINSYHFSTAMLAGLYYGFPGHKMSMIGVTGTNGKTTTVHIIAHILHNMQSSKIGHISTVSWNLGKGEVVNNLRMTMPGRFKMQKFLRNMRRNNCGFCVVETTSEGMAQYRGFGLGFNVGVFTNLSPEHVESHGSFLEYKKAKGKLFKSLGRNCAKQQNTNFSACGTRLRFRPATQDSSEPARSDASSLNKTSRVRGLGRSLLFFPARSSLACLKQSSAEKFDSVVLNHSNSNSVSIINLDDKHAGYFLSFPSDVKYVYAIDNRASKPYRIPENKYRDCVFKKVIARELKLDQHGAEFKIRGVKFQTSLLGEFNVYNALAGICTALCCGMSLIQIKKALKSFKGVAGRLEFIQKKPFSVIVDYAHTPDSFLKLFKSLKPFFKGKWIVVFGSAGGVRDKAKRPKLGKIASKYCDYIVLTNEDPYDSCPMEILGDIEKGISNKNNKKQFKKDFQDFYKLLKNSSQKNKFKIYNKAYYFKFLQMQISELFIAEYKGRVLAGNVVVFYKQKAHGIHGANSADMRNLRAPYLMQWKRILNAKKRHCKFYDFWGIGKNWPGITKFKKGFGGREVEYMNAYDIIFNIPWHVFYVFYTKINRFLKLCTGCN